jgi:hypothetical protein
VSNLTKDVQNCESRSAPNQRVDCHSFGSAGLGIDSAIEAWTNILQVFYSEVQPYGVVCPGHPDALFVGHMDRLGKTFLDRHSVELLLLGDLTAKREAD